MTYQHIRIQRIPVALGLAMSDAHNAEVQREERLAQSATALFRALQRAHDETRARYAVLGLPYPDWVDDARSALNAVDGGAP